MSDEGSSDFEGVIGGDEKFEIVEANALGALQRAEIDIQIVTAKRFPRSVAKARKQAEGMATLSQETAETCYYKLERGGKRIIGPSIRLAEIYANAWGNIRHAARIIGIDDEFVTAQGVAFDLESNNSSSVEVKRRITNSKGQRYNADMIGVTANAACSIALRNAIFKVIPKAYVDETMRKAIACAVGDEKTLPERRKRQIEYLTQKVGIELPRILAVLKRDKVDDITLADMEDLLGLATAIRDGEIEKDKAFPPLNSSNAGESEGAKTGDQGGSKTDRLASGINAGKANTDKPAEHDKKSESSEGNTDSGELTPDEIAAAKNWPEFAKLATFFGRAAGHADAKIEAKLSSMGTGVAGNKGKDGRDEREMLLALMKRKSFEW